jgi:hypothetical protein
MRLLRRAFTSTGGRTVLVVLVAMLVFQVWILVQAPRKIDERVQELDDTRGRVNVEVELAFTPERFHILVIQQHGRIRRTRGEIVEVHRITMDGVHALARRHWVRAIRPAEVTGR